MSRGIRTLALALTTLLALGASPAAADDPYDVPDSATITIRGDGSGHGIGMSQYGAYSAARAPHELTYRQILGFYYPGTRTGEAAGEIKVWIFDDDDRDLLVDAVDGLRIAVVGGRAWRRLPDARQWRVRAAGEDNLVQYRTRRWHTWKVVADDVELSAGRTPLRLHTREGTVAYRGALRSVDLTGQRLTVNVLPLEAYLRGVVPAEMQAGWPQHALRAQAVAARTFAVHERGDGNTYYDTCDTASCQAYGGVAVEARASNRAVAATAGEVRTFEGEVAFAQYSASNGGWTVADERFPYLPAQRDPYEGTSSDYYGWRRTLTSRQLEVVLSMPDLAEIQVEERDGRGPRGGRVTQVGATGRNGAYEPIDGEDFRAYFGLPSSLFEITRVE